MPSPTSAPNRPGHTGPAKTGPAKTGEKSSLPLMALIAGWLVPGAGYLLTGKYIRAALVAVSVCALFALGLGMGAKIFQLGTGDWLDMLGFVGQLGLGLLYVLARVFGLGHSTVLTVLQDYGTKYVLAGGLLNLMAAVDAHALASGRKLSIETWTSPLVLSSATAPAGTAATVPVSAADVTTERAQ
jgi:hypothetical protein